MKLLIHLMFWSYVLCFQQTSEKKKHWVPFHNSTRTSEILSNTSFNINKRKEFKAQNWRFGIHHYIINTYSWTEMT